MKYLIFAAALSGTAAMAGETEGDTFIATTYTAYIGMNDLTNSGGDRLPNAAAVIQQDRANVHRFGLADANDEDDLHFEDADARADIPELIAADGGIDADLARLIMQGNVQVYVDVKMTGETVTGISVYVLG